MSSLASDTAPSAESMAAVVAERDALAERVAWLEQQLDWFKRQIFGQTSERRPVEPAPGQMSLGEAFDSPAPESAPSRG